MRNVPHDIPAAIWHVTGRVNWRVFHLESDFAYRTLTRILRRELEAFGVDLLSDVLMDNHYHMVHRSPPEAEFRRLLLALQSDRASRDVFEAFERRGIPHWSIRVQKLTDELLAGAQPDPLHCGIDTAP